jgi:hypothetical protein
LELDSPLDEAEVIHHLFQRLHTIGSVRQGEAGTCGTIPSIHAGLAFRPEFIFRLVWDAFNGDDDVLLGDRLVRIEAPWDESSARGRDPCDAALQNILMQVASHGRYNALADRVAAPSGTWAKGLTPNEMAAALEGIFPELRFTHLGLASSDTATPEDRVNAQRALLDKLATNPFAFGVAGLSWKDGDLNRHHAVTVLRVDMRSGMVYFLNSWVTNSPVGTTLERPPGAVVISNQERIFGLDCSQFVPLLDAVVVGENWSVPPEYSRAEIHDLLPP